MCPGSPSNASAPKGSVANTTSSDTRAIGQNVPMSERESTTVTHVRDLRDGDYLAVITQLDDWWGGRAMTDMLPRLFFQHFNTTSFAAIDEVDAIRGFLCGFVSQTEPTMSYIHFVGVDPVARAHGVGALL